jgi:carboxylesterase
MTELEQIVPAADPALHLAGPTACLLLHGFTSQPQEMSFLADDLFQRGYTVLNLRLAGHGTQPADLARVHWQDWLLSVEEGLDLLHGCSEHAFLIGQSMGAMTALAAAARMQTAGVVALSTPFYGFPFYSIILSHLAGLLGWTARKSADEDPVLGARREAGYPAYARYPAGIIAELAGLNRAMRLSLPQVRVPVLLIQSRQDLEGRDDLEKIYARLGSVTKERIWLEGFDHSVVRDDKRAAVFNAIDRFIQTTGS